MECRDCGRALDRDARFCPACGVAVVSACAACGSELDTDARFCKRCGQPVDSPTDVPAAPDASGTAPAMERKVATMLFADIVGFTQLTERHDAEVVSRLVSETFERLSGEVDRYGGTVEKFVGDALLAVFGVPSTHEDDPERAVRAALEMQTLMQGRDPERGAGLRLRIGIESGEVLADLERSSGERDLFVTGDAVNTAARLQSVAEPGTVVVGPATYASTRGLIEYEELDPQAVKGKQLPVASWRAVRVQARRGGLRAPLGIEAPLIGRDEELTLLKETVRRTVSEARPHLVTVLGEAGVGKTRLIWELEKYLDGLPETFYWRKGRCYSYASVSYSPLVEVVKADARIADDDATAVVAAKLDARIAALGVAGDPSTRAAMGTLMGLHVEVQLAQDELFEAWRVYLAAIAAQDPLVLVVEDIHWADEVTLDFIEFVARWGDAPITIVSVARPELLERRATWGGGIRNASIVELSPLEIDESAAMIDELLDGAMPHDMRDRVVAMANGNPLFTEELVRMFVDQGALRMADGAWRFLGTIDELAVPSTVQAVLSARLDELSVDEKRVAQEASVVGRIFWDIIVAHLRDRPAAEVADALQGLRFKELVAPRTPSTLAGAAEWSFHHVLVRDVAYDSLPKADRGALHLQVASWAERELADRIDEFAELIASHTEASLRYEEELRTSDTDDARIVSLRARSLAAAERAARRAAAVKDRRSARRWQLVAIDQARRLGRPVEERVRLAEEFHDRAGHELDASERVAIFREAVELLGPAEELEGDLRESWGRLCAFLGEALYENGEVVEARTLLAATADAMCDDSPSAARARVLQTHSWVLWHDYEFELARSTADEAIAEAQEAGAPGVHRTAMHEAGVIRAFLGDPTGGVELLRESMSLALAADDRDLMQRCYVNIPAILIHSGFDLSEPAKLLAEGALLGRRSASYGTLSFLYDNLANVTWFQGRFEESLQYSHDALDAAERAGHANLRVATHRSAAEALHALGRVEEAEAELAAVDLASSDPQHLDWLLALRSRIELTADPERALARLRGDHPEFRGYPNAERTVAFWLGRMAYRVGDHAALAEAIAVQQRLGEHAGPGRRLELAWTTALADSDRARLESIGPEFAALGHRLYSVEALIDAALVAAREGADETAEILERAKAAVADLDYLPTLGPLPETRWLEASLEGERSSTA